MHTGFTVAACRGCSCGTARHGTAQHGSPRARLPRHGCTATAPAPDLCSGSPKASPQHCLHCRACRQASAGLFGGVPHKGPSHPQIFQKKRSSPAAFNVVFPQAEPRTVPKAWGDPQVSPRELCPSRSAEEGHMEEARGNKEWLVKS